MRNESRAELIMRHKRSDPFNIVYKDIAEHPAMSFQARGLMLYLLGKPVNWRINIGDLVKQSPHGKAFVRGILNELRRLGYLKLERRRGVLGEFAGWDWMLSDQPKWVDDPEAVVLQENHLRKCATMKRPVKFLRPPRTERRYMVKRPTVERPTVERPTVFRHLSNKEGTKKEGVPRMKALRALRTTTSSIRAEKPPGAAGGRPITPDGVNHKLCGPVSELDPAIATTDELLAALPSMNKDDVETVVQNHEAVSLLKFWLTNYGRLFGKKPRFTPADILAALDLVQCGMEVRDLIAAIIRAWMEPISTDPDSHNPYWACNHYSRSLADLAKTNSGQDKSNFDRMLVEMGWRGYPKQVEKSFELLANLASRR